MGRVASAGFILVGCLLIFAGCSGGAQSPPVGIAGLRVLAPVPGSSVGVAYALITNGSRERRLVDVTSPNFERVEMHTTVRDGDRSMMRPLNSVQFAPGESVAFTEGGNHLMLWNPASGLTVGDAVELYFNFDDGFVVVSSTAMRSRLD